MFTYTNYVRNGDGDRIPKEVHGASCLDDWLEAWQFAMVGFVHGRVVESGIAEAYRDHFKQLANLYPDCWHIACAAEWTCRFEWAPKELRCQRLFAESNPAFSSFNKVQPWNSVLLAAVSGIEAMQFWKTELEDKARAWQRQGHAAARPSWVNRQEALYQPGGATAARSPGGNGAQVGGQPQVQNPPGTGRRAARKAAAETRRGSQGQPPPPPPVPNPEWANGRPPRRGQYPEWANQRRPDGRYMYAEDGTEICYTYSRTADGCSTECTATPPRAHACEWCRGQHRSIRCPSHPNWVPPPKTKGKGRGKSKST